MIFFFFRNIAVLFFILTNTLTNRTLNLLDLTAVCMLCISNCHVLDLKRHRLCSG